MKDLWDLKDLTIHDAQPIRDEYTTGRRHSLAQAGVQNGAPRPVLNHHVPVSRRWSALLPCGRSRYQTSEFLNTSEFPTELPTHIPPARRVGSNRLFQGRDLYRRSPESGDVWYKSRRLKGTI